VAKFIFGGSFNPVHKGHIDPLLALQKRYHIPHIELLPNAVSPFKLQQQTLSNKHRLAMLKIATAETSGLSINTHEINASGISYTYKSIIALSKNTEKLFFIMGMDSFLSFPNWKEYGQILNNCCLIVLPRPAQLESDINLLPEDLQNRLAFDFNIKNAYTTGKIYLVETPLLAVSSSQIRTELKKGNKQIKYIDPSVLNYINNHHLYV
jgi:nicotinate-nucleotide adenylyltransferase